MVEDTADQVDHGGPPEDRRCRYPRRSRPCGGLKNHVGVDGGAQLAPSDAHSSYLSLKAVAEYQEFMNTQEPPRTAD